MMVLYTSPEVFARIGKKNRIHQAQTYLIMNSGEIK
tara:strand:+ start:1948 stop:2055 length:108 start_codon:yes stop_codon:yes gene_type:complete